MVSIALTVKLSTEASQTQTQTQTQTQKSPKSPTKVPKRDIFIVLPYLGFQSKAITQQLMSCIYTDSMVVLTFKLFSETLAELSLFFPYKDRLNRSLTSKVVYNESCWDCDDF